jgi:hypothetical protein
MSYEIGYLHIDNFHMAATLFTYTSTSKYKKHSTFFEDVLKHITSELSIKCY